MGVPRILIFVLFFFVLIKCMSCTRTPHILLSTVPFCERTYIILATDYLPSEIEHFLTMELNVATDKVKKDQLKKWQVICENVIHSRVLTLKGCSHHTHTKLTLRSRCHHMTIHHQDPTSYHTHHRSGCGMYHQHLHPRHYHTQ